MFHSRKQQQAAFARMQARTSFALTPKDRPKFRITGKGGRARRNRALVGAGGLTVGGIGLTAAMKYGELHPLGPIVLGVPGQGIWYTTRDLGNRGQGRYIYNDSIRATPRQERALEWLRRLSPKFAEATGAEFHDGHWHLRGTSKFNGTISRLQTKWGHYLDQKSAWGIGGPGKLYDSIRRNSENLQGFAEKMTHKATQPLRGAIAERVRGRVYGLNKLGLRANRAVAARFRLVGKRIVKRAAVRLAERV